MFKAFVIVCAASLNLEIYENTCLKSEDAWGPYKTEENCAIRARQMVDEVSAGPVNEAFTLLLNNPEKIFVKGFCEELEGENV